MDEKINADRALGTKNALSEDLLGRNVFAEAAVRTLAGVSAEWGFVVSIEGEWGSGKTSALRMIEELLEKESDKPIVVHFNPWIVGERDALIRQFFASINEKLNVKDRIAETKKVVDAIRNYSKIFDALKLIPGAAGIADVIKQVMTSVADSAEGVANERELDLEGKRNALQNALRQLSSRIVVFIDDVDRLLPAEVLEIVRIVKAVGDLPNIGYVVAWDSSYIVRALAAADIPKPSGYLDKIVQVRLPLPAISESRRQRLFQMHLNALQPEATRTYFLEGEELLQSVYLYGMRDLLLHPRDFVRMMNSLRVIEPTLRGEIVLADLLGLACLMTKAPSVYDAVRTNSHLFQGRLGSFRHLPDNQRKKYFQDEAKRLWESVENPVAVEELVFFLFPEFAAACGKTVVRYRGDEHGRLSEPGRFALAVSFNLSETDVSFVEARRYIFDYESRHLVVNRLDGDGYVDFIEAVGKLASTTDISSIDVCQLVVDVARLADAPVLGELLANRDSISISRPESTASAAIWKILSELDDEELRSAATLAVVRDEKALSVRAEVLYGSMGSRSREAGLALASSIASRELKRLSRDAIERAKAGDFWSLCAPGLVIWTIMKFGEESVCRKLFANLRSADPTLDKFALFFLKHSYSSNGGQSYALPKDRELFEKLVPLKTFKRHARKQLEERSLTYPLLAAWNCVLTEKVLLGRDGGEVDR